MRYLDVPQKMMGIDTTLMFFLDSLLKFQEAIVIHTKVLPLSIRNIVIPFLVIPLLITMYPLSEPASLCKNL